MPVPRTIVDMRDTLNASEKPLTTKELANAIGLSEQSIRNHIPKAIELGYIALSKIRHGRAYLYESTTRNQNMLPTVRIGDNNIILRDVLTALTDEERRLFWTNGSLNPKLVIAAVIQRLFSRAANALDEDHPTPVALSELKEFKKILRDIRGELQTNITAIDSMLNQEELWNPREMPKALIINDDEIIDTFQVKRILASVIKDDK